VPPRWLATTRSEEPQSGETAKANNIEPHAYLSHLFAQLPLASTVEDFEALLPWNVKVAPTSHLHALAQRKHAVI
jgi:hypothetical protein